MILLKKINEHNPIVYQSFINAEEKTFNFLANVDSDNSSFVSIGDAGLLLINEVGIIIEIELLFIKPFLENYPLINSSNNIKHGLPFFIIKKNNLPQELILYVDRAQQKVLILFEHHISIELIIEHNNARFLINNNQLIGIESTNIIFDRDDELQTKWLRKYNLLF